jgi:hypothetical protein
MAMAKAKKRVAVRKKSSKRGKATNKSARKNKAKRTLVKNSKSKVRRVGRPKVVIDARAKLEALSLAERIAAVEVDVASKRDEYRSIEPHELALLLDIGDAYQPGGDWVSVWFVPYVPIEDIFNMWDKDSGLEFFELLKGHVRTERYEELKSKIALLDFGENLSRQSLDFLTEVEKQEFERQYMENQHEAFEPSRSAFYTINAPHRKKLIFEACIEDDGGCIDLRTPYDKRDGAFTDLSNCLILEDHRR